MYSDEVGEEEARATGGKKWRAEGRGGKEEKALAY